VKILKHGNLKPRKFICKDCGCEFVANISEYSSYPNSATGFWLYSDCPECEARTFDSEQWEEEDDTKRN
jgi:hypothetical protein